MGFLNKKLAGIIRGKKDDLADIVGYVEHIGPANISGWVFSRSGAPVRLACRVDGRDHAVEAVWRERGDLEEKFGVVAFRSGFQIAPTAALRDALVRPGLAGADVALLANGQALPIDTTALGRLQVESEPLEIGAHTGTLRANVEAWQPFILRGWVVSNRGGGVTLAVTANGKAMPCSIVRFDRKDVGAALNVACDELGFEIVLPGYLWELAGDADACEIRIQANGETITPSAILLSRATAVRWIQQIAQLNTWRERQFFGLLAVEHVHFGGFLPGLDGATRTFIGDLAREMGVDELLPESGVGETSIAAVPSEEASTQVLWSAMRELNAALERPGASPFDLFTAALRNSRLRGRAREWFLNLGVQLTCASGEFELFRRKTDLNHLWQFEQSALAHQLTLLLPVLVVDRQFGRAAELLRRLANNLQASWIHTECIRYSLQLVQQMEADGDCDLLEAEGVRAAFLAVLEGFRGQWHSRLHDSELIRALAAILADRERYTDHHRRQIVTTAVRNYGLSPAFWQAIEGLPRPADGGELERAEAAWKELKAFLEADAAQNGGTAAVVDAITYFQRRWNPEVDNLLRDLVASRLPAWNDGPSDAEVRCIRMLVEREPSEAVRLAAFPLGSSNRIQARYPEIAGQLPGLVRQIGGQTNSELRELHLSAASALQRVQAALRSGDRTSFSAAITSLEQKAVGLLNWKSMYLGIDLLAAAYCAAASGGINDDRSLSRILDSIRLMLKTVNPAWYVPAPIGTGLLRIAQLQHDAVATACVREAMNDINAKLNMPQELPAVPAEGDARAAAAALWPQDTLVVVQSSRGNLGTRVRAMRDTWLRDLQERGIPFLVVVGGERVELAGDVLTLDVSDRPEDGPQRTLRLFEWVYAHTGAHYVIKAEDDCYLDVGRFFDSLSYRMHFYYGSIVRSEVGGLDRSVRRGGGLSPEVPMVLDKSPEPSQYADGRAAYCLSRFALQKLHEMRSAEAGRRIIAGSLREDKMVGDLLALASIFPHNDDYLCHLQPCPAQGGLRAAPGEHTFAVSRSTPTLSMQVAAEKGFAEAHALRSSDGLAPKKIWPTYAGPSLKRNGNQLQLLTDAGDLERLLKHELAVVSVVRNERVMLPHFLEHYRRLGVKCFLFADNCSDDGTREYLAAQPDTAVYSADTEYRHSHYGVDWQQAILGNHCLGKWALLADADELLVYENCETVPMTELVRSIGAEGRNGVMLYMIDMYPYGDLEDASFEEVDPFIAAPYFDRAPLIELRFGGGMYGNSRNYVSGLRHRIAPSRINAYVSQKYALFKYYPWIRLTEGVHYAANLSLTEKPVFFAHFKYHRGFSRKVREEIKRKQHFNGAEEYQRYMGMLAEGRGGFGAEGLSERYRDSSSFLSIVDRLRGER